MKNGYQGLNARSRVQYLLNRYQVWEVVHNSCCSKGTTRQVWERFQYISCLSHQKCQQESNSTEKVSIVSKTRLAKLQKTNATHGTFKRYIELKKYSREEYNSMSTPAGIWASEERKTYEVSENPRKLQSTDSSNECLFSDEKPKLMTETIQPLTEREVEPDRATQTLDDQGHQEETVSSACWETEMTSSLPPSALWWLRLQLQGVNLK